jgi:Tol biopolymer transport system component
MPRSYSRRGVTHALHIGRASALLLAALGAWHAAAQNRADATPDRLSYSTFAPSNLDIYVFDGTGAEPRRLTDHPALDYDAVVSPDGRWLVFCSERRGNPDLYVLDLARDRREPQLLIDSDALEDQAAFAPDGRSIAFVSTASGNADVYTLPFAPNETAKIGAARNVTNEPGGDFRPAFSPDGRTLAFSSDRGQPVYTPPNAPRSITRLRTGDLYAVELATLRTTRLTHTPGWEGSPAWSPDGKTIVFYAERGTVFEHIDTGLFAMNADGSDRRAIATAGAVGVLSPKCLPDGRIVFARRTKPYVPPSAWYDLGSWHLASVQADGSDLRIERDDAARNYWGPGPGPTPGTIVAYGTAPSAAGAADAGDFLAGGAPFRRSVAGRAVDVYPVRPSLGAVQHPLLPLLLKNEMPGADLTVYNLDGTEPHRLIEFAAPRNRPFGFNYSRDGAWIAFSRGGAATLFGGPPDGDVWKIRSDGTELTNLTPDSAEDDGYPSFSGDGEWIVFRRGTRNHNDLYLMKNDGSSVRRLTEGGANHLDPAFSPTAKRIAFVSNRADPTSVLNDVYLMELADDLSVRSLQRVTTTDGQEGHVAFSHDGEWLVFTSEQGDINDEQPLYPQPQAYGEIYAYRLADGTTLRLTHDKWEDGAPSWEKGVAVR